jgi:hypothetical protein
MRPALAAAGALALAGCAQTQQLGYYPDPWSAAYAYVYQPAIAYGLDGRYTPFVYPDGYDGYHTHFVIPESAERLSGPHEHR